MPHQFDSFSQSRQTPLRPRIILHRIRVILIVRIVLVQAIIGQVHILLLLEAEIPMGAALRILLRRKASQTVLVYVDAKRIYRGESHIDTQIKFVSVNEQWIGDVFADDHLRARRDLPNVLRNENTFPL